MDGVRVQVSKSEFGEKFLKNIPVLQWAQHVSHEQHRRLSQYRGAHGWAEIDYQSEFMFPQLLFTFLYSYIFSFFIFCITFLCIFLHL